EGFGVAVPAVPDAPPAAGRAVAGIAGRSVLGADGRGTMRGGAVLGNGAGGVVGRCSSMRRRNVGGTTRPACAGGAGGFRRWRGRSFGNRHRLDLFREDCWRRGRFLDRWRCFNRRLWLYDGLNVYRRRW